MPSAYTPRDSAAEAIRRGTQSIWTETISADRYRAFGEKYLYDPVGFVQDCILWNKNKGEGPTIYQCEILEALVSEKRVSARGPRGMGKSGLSSWAVLWFSLTHDAMMLDWKVPTTASAWRQLTKFLWPEINKWSRRLNWGKIGRDEFRLKDELTTRAINLKYGQAFAVASNRADLIEGAHADYLLYLFDESKIISDATWDSAEGAMTGGEEAYFLAVSTPGPPSGRFYDIQSKARGYEDWWVRHVTLQECVDAGRMDVKWANDRLEQWGEESAMYQQHVLGNFASEEADTLVPLHWIEEAIQRWYHRRAQGDWGTLDQIGQDVARMGGDKSVTAHRHGMSIAKLDKRAKMDTMQTAGFVAPYLRRDPDLHVEIDIVGLGAGTFDRLVEQFPDSDNINPFHPQERTDFLDASELWEFQDTYSAAWWNVRELLDPNNPRKLDQLLALPPDDDLKRELSFPKWKILSSGKIQVQPKEKVKEELGQSPDCADAVVMACWEGDGGGMEFG